ncbi:hypothetical protein [Algibacter sp. R77976]|uniref:hypothetical protein n=1 Tax=Algibacter sp. R77976 TaxID=3093873 RepID=UPI0037CB42DC
MQHIIGAIKVMNDEALKRVFENTLFGHYKFFIDLFFSFIFLIGVFFTQRALNHIVRKGVYNTMISSLLRKGGLFFMISGFCGTIINLIIPLIRLKGNFFDMFFGNDFFVLIIGVGLRYASDIIQGGIFLKQENDLTI